jgi:hypothetical protein
MKINKLTVIAFCLLDVCAFAQNQQLEEKLMALKPNQVNNKQSWRSTPERKPKPSASRAR